VGDGVKRKKGQAALIFDSLLEPSLSEKYMTLREVTRTVISLVENTSGCPVVVSEDASLTTFAASRIARGGNKIQWSLRIDPFRLPWLNLLSYAA
jgi:hypothetical protein